MDSDNANNFIDEQSSNEKTNFFNYLTNTFFNNDDKNNNIYNDDDEIYDFDQAYKNIYKLSKMDMNDLKKHFKLNETYLNNNLDDLNYTKNNYYNSKYFNVMENPLKYQTDFEIYINNDETIKYIKIKK